MMAEDLRMRTCPDDERLGAFVEGGLSGAVRDEVERHVASCVTCLDVVAASLGTSPDARLSCPVSPATNAAGNRIAGRAARPRGRRPSPWRRLVWAAGLVLVAGVLLRAAAPGLPGFASMIGRLASRWLDADVRVAAVGGRLGPSGTLVVNLRGLQWGHGPTSFAADEIEATVALATLVSGDAPLRYVRLVRPRLEVTQPLALAAVALRDQRVRVLAALDSFRRVDVVDGTIVVHGTTVRAEAIEGVTGGLEMENGEGLFVLQGQVGSGTLDVTGVVGDDPLALTIAGRDLDARIVALLTGRVEGVADVRVDVAGRGDDSRVDGRVVVRDGRWLGGGPPRLLGMDAGVRQRLAATMPRFAEDDLVFDEARAVLAWRRGTWRLPRVFVTVGDVVAGGAVRIGRDGTLEGRGTLRVPAALVREFAPSAPALATMVAPVGSSTLPFVLRGSISEPRVALGGP